MRKILDFALSFVGVLFLFILLFGDISIKEYVEIISFFCVVFLFKLDDIISLVKQKHVVTVSFKEEKPSEEAAFSLKEIKKAYYAGYNVNHMNPCDPESDPYFHEIIEKK